MNFDEFFHTRIKRKEWVIFSFFFFVIFITLIAFALDYSFSRKDQLRLKTKQTVALAALVGGVVDDRMERWNDWVAVLADATSLPNIAEKEHLTMLLPAWSFLLFISKEGDGEVLWSRNKDFNEGTFPFHSWATDTLTFDLAHPYYLKRGENYYRLFEHPATYHGKAGIIIGGFDLNYLAWSINKFDFEKAANSLFFVLPNQMILPIKKGKLETWNRYMADSALMSMIIKATRDFGVERSQELVAMEVLKAHDLKVVAITEKAPVIWEINKHFLSILLVFLAALIVISLFSLFFFRLLNRVLNETTVSRDYLDKVVHSIYGMFFVMDSNWRVTTTSEATCRVLGYSEQEIIGKPLTDLFETDLEELKKSPQFKRLLRNGFVENIEAHIRTKGGSVIPILFNCALLLGSGRRAEGFLLVALDVTALKKAETTLRFLAEHDVLTGLYNRHLFHNLLQQEIKRSLRSNEQFAVFALDLDRFKDINDTWGHDVGDQLLQDVAKRVHQTLRQEDSLARMGGDEFSALVVRIRDEADAGDIAKKVCDALDQPFQIGNHSFIIGVSIGIATYPSAGGTADDLLKHADVALYRAKQLGRRNYQFYSQEIHEKHVAEVRLGQLLAAGLHKDELYLVYQPIVDMNLGKIVAVESLVRWKNPEAGLVEPGVFVSLAEKRGLGFELGKWTLERLCCDVAEWRKQGIELPASLNVSSKLIRTEEFAKLYKTQLEKHGLSSQDIKLELTELIIAGEEEKIAYSCKMLEQMHAQVWLDDFGMGYSALRRIKRSFIVGLKIDRDLIGGIGVNVDDEVIIQSIIGLGRQLSLSVIAQGVETQVQRDFLQKHHCQLGQGWLYGHPLDKDQFLAQINRSVDHA